MKKLLLLSETINTVSELEGINSELDSTIHKIDELNAKDSLTLVEQDELEKLEKTTSNLKRQQKILETLKQGKYKDAINSAVKYFTTKDDNDSHEHPLYVDAFGWGNEATNDMLSTSYLDTNNVKLYDKVTNLEGAEQHLERLKEIKKEQDDLYI